jgi:hypothetical protein
VIHNINIENEDSVFSMISMSDCVACRVHCYRLVSIITDEDRSVSINIYYYRWLQCFSVVARDYCGCSSYDGRLASFII